MSLPYTWWEDRIDQRLNERNNNAENLSIIQDVQHDKDDEMIQEQPPSLVDALVVIRKLHLFTSIRQPELH
jgi:hypothetical protein